MEKPQVIATQQIDEIKNLYRNFKNLNLSLGSHSAVDLGDNYEHSLSQPMLPTIKVQEVHKTTTTILPPLPRSPMPPLSGKQQFAINQYKPITN